VVVPVFCPVGKLETEQGESSSENRIGFKDSRVDGEVIRFFFFGYPPWGGAI